MRPPMDGEPAFWFVLAAEDAPSHAAVTRLTERVLEEAIAWFSPELCRWRGPTPLNAYWKVMSAAENARNLGLSLLGNFGGKDELEAVVYRAQLLVWKHEHEHGKRIDVGFIARDTDLKPRKRGAKAAVDSAAWPFDVVLAFPHPEIEAWRIAVYEPATKAAAERVTQLKRRLGFSPIDHPERLTSTVGGASCDAKTVSDALFMEDEQGAVDAWLEIDLSVLHRRGQSCGLTDFLKEIEGVVVRRLDPSAAPKGDESMVPTWRRSRNA